MGWGGAVPAGGRGGARPRGPRADRGALGALKPSAGHRVRRQLSVIVNVDTAPQWQNQWRYRRHQSQKAQETLFFSFPAAARQRLKRKRTDGERKQEEEWSLLAIISRADWGGWAQCDSSDSRCLNSTPPSKKQAAFFR